MAQLEPVVGLTVYLRPSTERRWLSVPSGPQFDVTVNVTLALDAVSLV